MISSQPEQPIKAQLALLLFEKNFITKDEYDTIISNDLDDALIATIIEIIADYLKNSRVDISKKDIFNILKFIKNPNSFGSYPVQLITESIIYRTNNIFNPESKIKIINEMLSEAPNLLTLYDVWNEDSPDYRQPLADKFNQKYKLNRDLSSAILQKNAECSRDPNQFNNFKIICDYSTSSISLALTITNNDTIGSIPGKAFKNIFSHVTNAILTKNNIRITSDSSSQGNFTENKAKYILLMMNELDRFNCLKDMSDQDKEIFAEFFERLPSIHPSQLTSINQTFRILYEDQVSSPELKFKQLVMHLNSLFNRDMSISSSNITSPATDAAIIISSSNNNANSPIFQLPQPLNQTQTSQNLFDDQEFAEIFYDFTSQPTQLQNRKRHEILELFRNGDDSLFPDLSNLGITLESLKEQWQNTHFDLVPPPPPLSGHEAQEQYQEKRKGEYYFKKEIEINGCKISLILDVNGLKKETITPKVETEKPINPKRENRKIGDLYYLGTFNDNKFKGTIYSKNSFFYFRGIASSQDNFKTVNLHGKIMHNQINFSELEKELFEIAEHSDNQEFVSVFKSKLDLPTLFANIDSSIPCELKKIGELYFLGNFHQSNQGEMFSGLILKNDDSPFFFKGTAILPPIERLRTNIELTRFLGSFINKNPDIAPIDYLHDSHIHAQRLNDLKESYLAGVGIVINNTDSTSKKAPSILPEAGASPSPEIAPSPSPEIVSLPSPQNKTGRREPEKLDPSCFSIFTRATARKPTRRDQILSKITEGSVSRLTKLFNGSRQVRQVR